MKINLPVLVLLVFDFIVFFPHGNDSRVELTQFLTVLEIKLIYLYAL